MSEEKKKLIRVEGYGDGTYGSSSRIQFSFLSSPEDGRRQVFNWQTCRDVANDLMRAYTHGDTDGRLCGGYYVGKNPPIDFDKLRLLVSKTDFSDDKDYEFYKQKLFSAKRILNYYEDMAGWQKTKITTVHHSQRGKNCWLFTGPKEWMRSSALVSLATLIIRILSKYGPLEETTPKSIEKFWDKLIGEADEKRKAGHGEDNDVDVYLRENREKFKVIMHHYDELFDSLDPKKVIFAIREDVNFNVAGGINHFCHCSTNIKELDDRMREVCDRYIEKGKYVDKG